MLGSFPLSRKLDVVNQEISSQQNLQHYRLMLGGIRVFGS
jgi:hypothetical protein